jgi:hypothetical protein
MKNEPKLRIVSEGDSSRVAASRIYLNDEEITPLVRDLKITVEGEARRYCAEFKIAAQVELEVPANVNFQATDPVDELISYIAGDTGIKPRRQTIENWLQAKGICTHRQLERYKKENERRTEALRQFLSENPGLVSEELH